MRAKLIADVLILASNAVFVLSVLKMLLNHVSGKLVQKPLPVLGSVVAINLLMCGQWTLGLIFSLALTGINAAMYTFMIYCTPSASAAGFGAAFSWWATIFYMIAWRTL